MSEEEEKERLEDELRDACWEGDLEEAKRLVGLGVDPQSQDSDGQTPLHYASTNGELHVVEYLTKELKVNSNATDNNGETPLHYACRFGYLDMVKYLVSNLKCDPKVTDRKGTTPLHLASEWGELDTVKYLVSELNCDPKVTDRRGRTPLHLASENGELDIVKYLVSDLKCDPKVTDRKGSTPLHLASELGRLDTVKYLVSELNCDPKVTDGEGNTPLHLASLRGRLDTVKYLVSELNCDPKVTDGDGNTPLHHASERGRLDAVKYLVSELNCDPKVTDGMGRTPLHLASQRGELDTVKYLVSELNCDPKVTDWKGRTPLHLASDGPSDDGWKSYTARERKQVVEYLEGLAETPPVSSGEPPKITTHPVDQKNAVDTVTFTVQASGTHPISYHWEYNVLHEGEDWESLPDGSDGIEGGNTATLTITGLKKEHEGAYRCNVTNPHGTDHSHPANLTLALDGDYTACLYTASSPSVRNERVALYTVCRSDSLMNTRENLKAQAEQVECMTMEMNRSESRVSAQSKEIAALKEQIGKKDDEIAALNAQAQAYLEDFEHERKDRQEEASKMKRLQEEYRQVVAQQKETQIQLDESHQRLEKNIADTAKLHDEVLAKTQQVKQYKKQADNYKAKLEQNRAGIGQYQSQLEEFRLHAQQREEEVTRLRQQLEEQSVNRQQVQKRHDDVLAQLQGMRSQRFEFWKVSPEDVVVLPGEEHVIGRGAWGYVAKGTFRGQRVAVKYLHQAIRDPRTVERVNREICTMAQVRHPNLVLFLAAVYEQGSPPMIVTELLDVDLRTAYETGRLQGSSKLVIFRDVACALNYLHQHREAIIHRDVSAPNVLLEALAGGVWKAKVSDFGSANLARYSKTLAEGAIVYAAPETYPQRPGARPLPQTTKIDVYSYGVLLCEVIIGEIPEPEQLRVKTQDVRKQWLSIYNLIDSCIQWEATDRPTMAKILTDLPQPLPRMHSSS